MSLAIDQVWLESFLLASVRILTFLMLAPPFNHGSFPARIKVMLSLGLALAVAPGVAAHYTPGSTGAFAATLALQVLVGGVLGFAVYLVTAAIQAAAGLIDLFGGFSMAQAFDPGSMVNGAQFTRLYHLTALVLMFTTDAYQLIIRGITRSFTAIPVGEGIDLGTPAQAFMTATTGMFLGAIQIAGPLLIVLFLADVALGLVNRVAPALNAFVLGFPLKIFLALTLASTMILSLPRIVSALVDEALELLVGVS